MKSTNCSSSKQQFSNLYPPGLQLGTNLTLWIVFKTDNVDALPDVYWAHKFDDTTFRGHLDHLDNTTYNASLKIVLDSVNKQGWYDVYVCGRVLEIFRVEQQCDGHCATLPLNVTHINSSVVLPNCRGNISLLCGLHGYRFGADVEWSTSAGTLLHSERFPVTTEPKPTCHSNCVFYHRLTIVNGTSEDTNNYTCSAYADGELVSKRTTTLSKF